MTSTWMIIVVVGWLALQIPVGIGIGSYMRHARSVARARVAQATYRAPRARRSFVPACRPPALLRG